MPDGLSLNDFTPDPAPAKTAPIAAVAPNDFTPDPAPAAAPVAAVAPNDFTPDAAPAAAAPTAPVVSAPTPEDYLSGIDPATGQAPSGPISDVFAGAGAGAQESVRNAIRTAAGQAFTADPNAAPETEHSWSYNLGKGMGGSGPVVAAGIAGGAGGGALGSAFGPIGTTVGGIVGAAGGVGAVSYAMALAPAYQRGLDQGLAPEQAEAYAWSHAKVEGAVGAATAPLFAIPSPLKSAVGKILFNALVTQPAAGTAARVATPALLGEPQQSVGELVSGAGQDVVTGGIFTGAHLLGERATAREAPGAPATERVEPQPPREVAPNDFTPDAAPAAEAVPAPPPGPPPAEGIVMRGALQPDEPLAAPAPVTEPQAPPPAPATPPEPVAAPEAAPAPPTEAVPGLAQVEAMRAEAVPPISAAVSEPAPEPAAAVSAPTEPAPLTPAPVEAQAPVPPELAAATPPAPQTSPVLPRSAEAAAPARETALPPSRTDIRSPAPASEASSPTAPSLPPSEPAKVSPSDQPDTTIGRPEPAPPLGAGRAPDVQPGEQPGRGGSERYPVAGAPDTQGARPPEPAAAAPGGAAPGVTAPEGAAAKGPSIRSEALTIEPDHTVPGQYVAKNEQGHVVAAGDTPEQARALAEERLNRRNADTTPANAPPEQSQTGQPRADLSAPEQSQPGQQPRADLSGRPDEHLKEPAAPPPEPGSQLAKLTATRDALAAAPGPKGKPRTRAQESKLQMLDQQIGQLQRSQQARAPKPVPGEGGPTAPGREVFDKYKFNSGPSVYRSVFEAAGHNPDLAVNKPIAWQNKVLSDHMEHAFGFRKVSLAHDATPVDAKTARDHMLDMTRSIQDMMASLGEMPDAASINGRVALTFDPLGKRNYYGAYDPGSKTIRISGNANSFAHEWAHAVDHFLAEDFNRASNRNELLTRYAQHGELDPKDGVQGAWAKVLNAVFYDKSAQASRQIELANTAKQTDKQGAPTAAAVKAQQDLKSLEAGGLRLGIQPSKFRAAAKEAGKGTSRPAYYTDPAELLARGREAQIAWKMETNGVDPRGVAMPDRAYLNESIKAFKELYPKAEDRMNIFKAFDDLDHEMAKKSILSLDKAPAEFGNFGVSDPRHYPKTVPGLEASPTAMSVKDQSRMWKNKTKQLETMKMVEAARPNPPKNLDWKTQQLDAAKSVIYSDHGLMEMHINRQTPEAQKPLREILDLLTPSPSSGRYTGEGLLEAQRQMEGDWNRRALNILKSAGVKSFGRIPADIDAMTRDVLVTGEPRYTPDLAKPDETVAAPDKVIKVAGDMRGLMDELYQASRDAGLPVGYADRYYPRMYDQAKALDQPDKFREQAAKAYGVGFDKEVGAPGADPQAALEHWTTLSAADKSLSYEKHPDLAEQMKALSKNLERQREIEQGGDLGSDEFTALKAEAQKLAAEAHPALRDHVSSFAANDWHNRISDAVSHHIDAQGSSGSYLNGRTLPPEADIHMRDFMHTSLRDVLPKYINNVARRVADAERFGPNGENLERLRKAAIDAGVHPETMNDFMESVDRTRGMNQERAPGGLTKTVGVIHAFSSMVMMPRSVWSQLTEPINLALSSHNLTAGLRASVYEIGALLRTASAAERSEFADFVGAVHYAQQDSIMNSRLGFDYADQPGLTKFMGNYFKLTGMTPATNGQRAGIAAASHYVLAKLARSYLNEKGGFAAGLKRDEAVRSFNELGIHPEVQPAFARWLADLPVRPTATALMQDKSGMAGAYGLAVRRVTDRAHQDPYKVDRAAMSMHPAFKLPFQMMSFNYSFQRNVINPAFHRIGHAYDWTKEAAQEKGYGAVGSRALALSMASGTAVKTFSIASTLVGASLMTTMVRQYLFSPDQWEQHKKDGDLFEWLRDLAMQRSGINGVLDPAVQVLTNLRYLSDLQSLYGGGGPTWILKNAQDMLAPLTSEPDDKTNTKMWRSVHGALNLIGLPLLAAGLNTLGAFGGPAGRVAAGATLQATTSSYAINKATNMIMGPKGAKKPTGDDELDDSADSELDDQALDDGDTAGSTKKSSGGIGGPIGLLDDVAMPLIRILAPAVNIIPGPVKAGLAGLGAAYAAAKVWEAGAPFRGRPAPAKHP